MILTTIDEISKEASYFLRVLGEENLKINKIDWMKRATKTLGKAKIYFQPNMKYELYFSTILWEKSSVSLRKEAIAHEVCHLVNVKQEIEKKGRYTDDQHGYNWECLMKKAGFKNPIKKHSLVLDKSITHPHKAYCKCGAVSCLTTIKFNRIKKGLRYRCRVCKDTVRLFP